MRRRQEGWRAGAGGQGTEGRHKPPPASGGVSSAAAPGRRGVPAAPPPAAAAAGSPAPAGALPGAAAGAPCADGQTDVDKATPTWPPGWGPSCPPPAPVPTHLLWLKSSSRCSSRWLRDSRTGFGNFLGWMRPPWPSVAMVREGTSPPSPSAGVAGVSGGWGHHGVGSPSPLGSLSPRGPPRPSTHPAPRCSSGRCCHPGKGKERGHTGTLSRSLAPCPAWAGDTAGDTFSRRQSRGFCGAGPLSPHGCHPPAPRVSLPCGGWVQGRES